MPVLGRAFLPFMSRQWLWSASSEDANGEKVRLSLSRVSEIVSHCAETKTRRGTAVESMNVMRTFATIALAVAVAFCVYAVDQKVVRPAISKYVPMGWTEDFDAARQQAAKDGKFVFAAFSGSDWCGPCMTQGKEVFSQKGFLHKLSKRYVPVMLSSPSDRSALSKLAIEQNDELKKRYDVRGFPTMVVVNPADGKEVKRQSVYRSGSGADAYLERLVGMMKSVEWPEAGGVANPLPKMHDLLSVLPETFVNHQYFYRKWAERLVAADSDGLRGWRACYPYVAKVLPRANEFGRLKGDFYRKLYARARKRIADEGTKASGSNWDKHVGITFGELADEWEPKLADVARPLELMDSEVPNGDSRFKFDNPKSSVGNMLRRFQEGCQRHRCKRSFAIIVQPDPKEKQRCKI